jgi:hypothetical protein
MEALKKLLIEKKDLWQKEREVQKEMELNAPDGWVTENLIDETGM